LAWLITILYANLPRFKDKRGYRGLAGYRNRAYRLPEDIVDDAKIAGFKIEKSIYPFSEPNTVTVANLTFLVKGIKK